MVSTRSLDRGGSNGGPPTLVANQSPVVQSRKRHQVHANPRGPHTKRRRIAAATENDTSTIDSISSTVNQTRLDNNAERFLGVQIPGRPGDGGNVGVTQHAIKVTRVLEAEGSKQSVRSKDLQKDPASNLETQDSSENKEGTIKATKAIHKRFGSEEMDLRSPQLDSNLASEIQNHQASEEKVGDEASDDEAPETVTAVAGFERARAAAAHAAKTIERKEAATKQKRKERDARLNLQAKSSRRRGIIEEDQPNTPSKSQTDVIENVPIRDEPNAKAASSPDTPLPTFLPKSILLAEPPNPLLNPPSSLSKSKKAPATKRNLLSLSTKTPKDVKHGSKTIRVLEVNSSSLPPRVSQSSKALREAWLAGRRGGSRGERGFVPRRKVGGGFVRK